VAEYEERDQDDLTEEPSQHRIDELRSKGQVAQSRELSGAMALLAVLCTIYFMSGKFVEEISGLMKDIFTKDLAKPMEIYDFRSFAVIANRCVKVMAFAFLPVALAGLVTGSLTAIAQVGFLITGETIQPDFKRVDPLSGFMRVFSFKSLLDGLKSSIKVVAVGMIVYGAIKSRLLALPNIITFGAAQTLNYIGETATRMFGALWILLFVAAGFDYWINWRRFRKQAMMTKSEAKQEMKEREGDPQIKARTRAIQRDMARKRMMKDVPRADVIITNPTHIAIAIRYDPNEGFAPKVLAKGADYLAERIKKIARENGIPTVENKPLARTLYKHVKVGQMVPRSLYQAVAEILAYVYKLKNRRL
jgi:flagellar biosynthetic protein FlhB